MSDTHASHVPDQHGSATAMAGAHGAAAGHGDDHSDGHGGSTLGPVDWTMWGVGAVGVVAALIITAGFVVATGFVFGA
jgi:hypothetical protein